MREPKIKLSDLQAEAQRLIDASQMPSLAEVLAAIAARRARSIVIES
jgi:hypothetical protein